MTSLIGARNGNVLDAARGDRGINGLLHNPMPYTIQVYRISDWRESDDWSTLTEFLSVINVAALTGASVMNASWGQPHPVNPDGSAYDARHPGTLRAIRVALRKLAHQLNQFRERLLLVVAAGNEAEPAGRDENGDGLDDRDPDGMRGLVTPFEDINLNGRLDAGEDYDNDGTLDDGNYVAASLGTLPNVITVGAIGGPSYGARGWARDDQRANFSNWGIPVTIAAPGTDVFAAGDVYIDFDSDPWNRERDREYSFLVGAVRFSRVDGTSFAAPLVTGSAALLKAIDPTLRPSQIKAYLIDTSFEVNTTDRTGALMVWRTLKTGYAVRKLMVDRGIIRDDQIWTGVSKVIYNGLRMFEIRRGPDGRAEAFADRELPGLIGTTPSLQHHGRVVLWIADARTIKEHAFDTGATNNRVGLPAGKQLEPILETAPDHHFLYGVRTIAGDCNRQVEVFAQPGAVRVADTGVFNICPFGLLGARDWQYYFLHRAAWRPDSRVWALDYFHANGRGNTTNQECRRLWDNNPFPPAAARPFPGCTDVEFRYPAWSPDGRAYAGGSSAKHLNIVYYDSLRDDRRRHREGIADTPLLWINWSPDGSELGYTGANGITTVRRDFRTPADRAPRLLQSGIGGVFTWQW